MNRLEPIRTHQESTRNNQNYIQIDQNQSVSVCWEPFDFQITIWTPAHLHMAIRYRSAPGQANEDGN